MSKIALVRPPALPFYQDTDVKEDPMLTAFLGYLVSIDIPKDEIDIFDFQLDRSITYKDILLKKYEHYVIASRDLGESYRYSIRVSKKLYADTDAKIWLYGQVAPLQNMNVENDRTKIVTQHEQNLAKNMNLSVEGAHFTKDLNYLSYFDKINLENWQINRKKGAIETTRGCPYKCKFCFITAGQNYEKRWQVRPNEQIIVDLKTYIQQGIYSFVFLDSEFLGANLAYYKEKKLLLTRIIKELPKIEYMILCRADTILAFNEFELLKQSGLKKILVGVESLYQPDLDALRKNATVETMMSAVKKLIKHKVECCLTFLTFHRNTTTTGLRENLKNIQRLYNEPNARYLGMPNFSFNMEVVRGSYEEIKLYELSNKTYLKPLLESRTQIKKDMAIFPTKLEPLIEIYRLLQYEWVVKKCELIKARQSEDTIIKEKVNQWFDQLGGFCINKMFEYLDILEAGNLRFDNLKEIKEELYASYRMFYKLLPSNLQKLATYDNHAQFIDYHHNLEMEDHGWDRIIPPEIALHARV